jgi:hypothetical protein
MRTATPTCCLLVGEINDALRSTGFGLLHGVSVRRVDGGEEMQLSRKGSAGQGVVQSRKIEWIVNCRNPEISILAGLLHELSPRIGRER